MYITNSTLSLLNSFLQQSDVNPSALQYSAKNIIKLLKNKKIEEEILLFHFKAYSSEKKYQFIKQLIEEEYNLQSRLFLDKLVQLIDSYEHKFLVKTVISYLLLYCGEIGIKLVDLIIDCEDCINHELLVSMREAIQNTFD